MLFKKMNLINVIIVRFYFFLVDIFRHQFINHQKQKCLINDKKDSFIKKWFVRIYMMC
jgi:hypothetical protein